MASFGRLPPNAALIIMLVVWITYFIRGQPASVDGTIKTVDEVNVI
jgi:hypothetical protein